MRRPTATHSLFTAAVLVAGGALGWVGVSILDLSTELADLNARNTVLEDDVTVLAEQLESEGIEPEVEVDTGGGRGERGDRGEGGPRRPRGARRGAGTAR